MSLEELHSLTGALVRSLWRRGQLLEDLTPQITLQRGSPHALSNLRKLMPIEKTKTAACCIQLGEGHPLAGLTLAQAQIRRRIGATVVGIERSGMYLECPSSQTKVIAGDIIHLEGPQAALESFARQ
ncbi:MAG: TrkA C-terminal domain-containing protein [Aphanocapsa lilacina HA4352-LM1]|jgi:K+/H+ antiporter YhaU regulatory subunit KhtT|nr:TrkA C-terminal domain-containing protein [Aphanocapsa lilacina HA4352-LM1]